MSATPGWLIGDFDAWFKLSSLSSSDSHSPPDSTSCRVSAALVVRIRKLRANKFSRAPPINANQKYEQFGYQDDNEFIFDISYDVAYFSKLSNTLVFTS